MNTQDMVAGMFNNIPLKAIYRGNTLIKDFEAIVNPDPVIATSIKDTGFRFGLMTKRDSLNSTNQVKMLQEAKMIVPENDFKSVVKSYDPITGNYTTSFTNTDPQVAWAKANGIEVKIHTGLWTNNTNTWIYNPKKPNDPQLATNPNMTPQKWKDLLKIMIQAPLLYYKNHPTLSGVVTRYDVLNEPWNEALVINETKEQWKFCIFVERIGESATSLYKQCLVWAREADPNIILLINEYGFEYGWLKVDRMVTFAQQCINENIPLDGFGLQLHQKANVSMTAIKNNLTRLAEYVNHVNLSEVALSMRYAPYFTSGQPFPYTAEMELVQAIKYRELFQAYTTSMPKFKQDGIYTWGTNDASYMGNDLVRYSMLFNDNYQRKLAYNYVLDYLNTLNVN